MTKKSTLKIKKAEKSKALLKTISVFFVYFFYSYILNSLFNGSIIASFIADILFMIGIVFAYKENLKEDIKTLKNKYNVGKIIKTILIWVIIIIFFNFFMGFITDLIFPNAQLDENSLSIRNLFGVSAFYTIFKTMLFGIVAEELLFRESIGEIIKNKWLFIIISSLIYTIINFAFTGLNDQNLFLSILTYFLPALIFSTAYYKNDKNIIILMMIKFIYQLIPLTLMFISA